MPAALDDAAAAAANLALKMGSGTADAIVFIADLGEELPFLEPVLKTIKAIREKGETVKRNREELAALEERCTYITACVIEKHRRTPTSEMDVTPLKNCVEAVEAFFEVCERSSRRGRLRRILKATNDKDEIAGLNARVDRLTGDLRLVGIVILENKVDNLNTILEDMTKGHAEKQVKIIAYQESLKRRQESFKRLQEEFGERLPKLPAKLAHIPKGAPATKSWHVERRQVMEKAIEALTEDGGTRLVGLVGDSGSGKTTASSDLVRTPEVLEAFHDGILWMPINKGAKERLPSLMMQLARMVYEDIGGSVGRAPATSDDGAAYIKQRMEEGHVGKGLKCLVVADNVWEKEVVLKLMETGMWVLLSTRDEELVKGSQGDNVGVYELSMEDAKSVLISAAEIPSAADLPDSADDLINLCGRVAMDLAFVGRWSTVRGRRDRLAWSDAVYKIRTEIAKVQAESENDCMESTHARRRKAILRAGFDDLAVGSDDMRVPRLYLSLAVMPDGHAFTVKDAAVLLCNLVPSAEDVESAGGILQTLERWTVVRLTEGTYRMHDSHSSFARESIMDRGDVRRSALEKWVGYISSLESLRSIDESVLKQLWLAVKRVGGDGWDESRPYTEALGVMGESDPLLRISVEAMGRFEEVQGNWQAASNTWRRLLEVEKRELGPDHPFVLNTLASLADCANRLGHDTEAAVWRKKGSEALPLALARIQLQLGAGGVQGTDEPCGLRHVGHHIWRWAPGHRPEEERLLRALLGAQEVTLDRNDIKVATTLHSLGVCVRLAGQLEEAERVLRRCLAIKEANLDRKGMQLAVTLHELGVCVRLAGRLEEAEKVLRRCLAIKEANLDPEGMEVAVTLHELGVCVRDTGRLGEADELMRRCLATKEANLSRQDMQVAVTLYELGVCVLSMGRLDEAEELLRRCLMIGEVNLGRQDMHVAVTLQQLGICVRLVGRLEEAEVLLRRSLMTMESKLGWEDVHGGVTLHELGVCVLDAGRLGEAEEVLRRCLAVKEATLGREDAQVAVTLHELGVCVRKSGRLGDAEELLRRCLPIKEAKLRGEDIGVAVTLNELGVCVRTAGRFDEAEGLLRRCLAIKEVKLGGEDVRVAVTLHELGVCVGKSGRLEEAEGLLRRSLAIAEISLDQEDVQVAYTLHELGHCVGGAGRLDEAAILLWRCLEIQETAMGREHLQVSITLHDLGVCVRDSGRLEEAEELLKRCLAIKEAKLGSEDVGVAITMRELGVCVRDTGRLEKAEELLRHCLVILETNVGGEIAQVATTMRELGVCVRDTGRLGEAEEVLKLCLAIVETNMCGFDVGVAHTLHELGSCVRKAGRLEEAEGLLKISLAIKEANLGRQGLRMANTLYELGICVRDEGRVEETEELLEIYGQGEGPD